MFRMTRFLCCAGVALGAVGIGNWVMAQGPEGGQPGGYGPAGARG